jgi:hypothetical protein
VAEVSVFGHLALLLWACGSTVLIVGMCGTEGLFTSWSLASKERERKGPVFQCPLQVHTPGT